MAGVPLPGVRATRVARSRGTEADIIREARLTVPPLSVQQPPERTEPMVITTTTIMAVTMTRTASISVRTSIHISRDTHQSQRRRLAEMTWREARSSRHAVFWQPFRCLENARQHKCPAGLRTSAGGLASATRNRCGTSKAADQAISVAEHKHGHEGHRQQPKENDSALYKPFPTHRLNVAPAYREKSSHPDLVRETSFTGWRAHGRRQRIDDINVMAGGTGARQTMHQNTRHRAPAAPGSSNARCRERSPAGNPA